MGGTEEDKKAKKKAMKAEAEKMGISYDELKAQKKAAKKKREAESLETDEHARDMKRMRTWSKDGEEGMRNGVNGNNDDGGKRRRTRSMDVAEEKKQEAEISPEAWRRENSIAVRGHGKNRDIQDIPAPFLQFRDAPFCESIQKAFTQAGFKTPTHIQSQVRRRRRRIS